MSARSSTDNRRSGDLCIVPAAAVFDDRLGLADLRILCALGCFANRAGKCWPATTTLAQDLGVSDRHVRACLRNLEACGHVRTEHRPGQRSVYLIVRKPLDPGSQSSGVEPNPGSESSATPEVGVPGTPEVGVPPNGVTNGTKNDNTNSSPSFDEFWRAYPKRSPHSNPKQPAKKKFEAAIQNGVISATIIRGATNYALYVETEGLNPKYVAQAQTWLNQERWQDHQEAPASVEREVAPL